MGKAVVLTFATALLTGVAGPVFTAAPAAAAVAAVTEATAQQKVDAARIVGFRPTEADLARTDCNFVFDLWRRAKEGTYVKADALAAYSAGRDTDGQQCTDFIITGIKAADRKDQDALITEEQKKEKARNEKRAALNKLNITVTEDLLNLDKKNFIITVWERSKDGSEVKKEAGKVIGASSTEADWDQFITVTVFSARDKDIARELAEQEEKERLEREKKANQDAKLAGARAALGTAATDDLKDLTDEQFIDFIYRKAEGTEVKRAAGAALDSRDPKKYHDFIFTGIHEAVKKDKDAADAKEFAELKKKVEEIRELAKRDGYQPELLKAADQVLASPTLASLREFVAKGQHEAAERDRVRPANGQVIELWAVQSKRCVQMAGVGDDAKNNGSGAELWDCGRDYVKQRFVLWDRGQGRYLIQNLNSEKCLVIRDASNNDNAATIQWDCSDAANALWEFVPTGDEYGSFEIRNWKSGKVMSMTGTDNAALVVQYTNGHGANQKVRLVDPNKVVDAVAVQTGRVELKGVGSNRCIQMVGVNGDELRNGAAYEIWDCNNAYAKEWFDLIDKGNKQYQLKSVHSGMCLVQSVAGGDNNISLVQRPCGDIPQQYFMFVPGGDGYYQIKNVANGKVVDVFGAGTANGVGLQQYDFWGGANQLWSLVRL
ncbi:hypothetical protein D5S17_15710 [Pseudonocardiaceae bacterium YIM PH 21723]|nr:hypothetical protein D5S17_15710 [Pseudonocardiaceae bacterium YIM PH 21723]